MNRPESSGRFFLENSPCIWIKQLICGIKIGLWGKYILFSNTFVGQYQPMPAAKPNAVSFLIAVYYSK